MSDNRVKGTTIIPVAIPTLDGKSIAETVDVKVPCLIDEATGETYLSGDALAEIDRVKARHMGLMTPEEIGFLRESLGLTQKEMSELLQIGAKSYSRWENGRERPSRSMNILLRSLYDRKIDADYLKSIKEKPLDWANMIAVYRPDDRKPILVQRPDLEELDVDETLTIVAS